MSAEPGNHALAYITRLDSKHQFNTKPDGTVDVMELFDADQAWVRGVKAATTELGLIVTKIYKLANMAKEAHLHTSPERAASIGYEITNLVNTYKLGIVAKGSESIRSNNVTQTTTLDMIAQNKREFVITDKGAAGKRSGFMNALLGKKKEDEIDKT